MSKIILTILFSVVFLSCKKEKITITQSRYFLKFYDIDYLEDKGYDMELTPDGGYVLAGSTKNRQGGDDIFLIKADKYGNQPGWSPVITGSAGNDTCKALAVVEDGYIIAGTTDSVMLLSKIGINGQVAWTTQYRNVGTINDVAVADNKIFTVGYYVEPGGTRKPFRSAFDLSGNLLDASIPPFAETGDYFTSMVQKGSVTSCLGTQFRNQLSNISLIEHGAEGTFSTQEVVFNEPQNEISSKIRTGRSGGFFVIGTIYPLSIGQSRIFLRKLNSDYTIDNSLSQSSLDNTLLNLGGNFRGTDICEMEDGKLVILGDRYISNDMNIILIFLLANGEVYHTKIFGKSGQQESTALLITPDKGLVILGNNTQEGNTMVTLIKTDSGGEIWE